jgi:hypothetical protein
MYKVQVIVTGNADLLLGKKIETLCGTTEEPAAWDERCCRERAWTNDDGYVCMNAIAIQRSIADAAKHLQMKLSGNKTYFDTFNRALMAMAPDGSNMIPILPLTKVKQLDHPDHNISLFVPSNCQRNSTKRVYRRFPRFVKGWKLKFDLFITDDKLTLDVLKKHLEATGLLIGFGTMRRGNGGPNGTFTVDSIKAIKE